MGCDNVDNKLRQIFDLTEDEANFSLKHVHSAFLYKLNVQTMPKESSLPATETNCRIFQILA